MASTKVQRLTKAERDAVSALKLLEAVWPASLWLFSAGGKLYVMQRPRGQERGIEKDGSMDDGYIVAEIEIDNDGGDW